LDGEVSLNIPAGSQSGQKLRLREKGLPKKDGQKGNLYVKLKIVVPKQLSPQERELFMQMQKTSKFNPRG